MDNLDRAIVNELQGGFPICERPFEAVAERLGTSEVTLIERIEQLLTQGTLSRFGPMYHAERMGGALVLCAMQVPEEAFERIAETVNAHPEVAHNYARAHSLNMWFVLATETPSRVTEVIDAIQAETGCHVYQMPKLEEYFVGLRLEV